MLKHAATVICKNPQNILSYLSRIPKAHTNGPLFFTLSSHADQLGDLVNALVSSTPSSVGCLSAPLPGGDTHVACSLAWFDSAGATPFRSTLEGRPAPQVGRWHAFRRRGEDAANAVDRLDDVTKDGPVDWEDVWARSGGETAEASPEELAQLQADDVHTILYLSDSAPEGLTRSLRNFPRATKLGLFASSTPFVTGRPVTLFNGAEVHSSGAVGLALHGSRRTTARVKFPGLVPITSQLTVTRAEGNLVQELNSDNPSRLLLNAIESEVDPLMAKQDEFFLGALDDAGELSQVYLITSGDPKRGTMALESGAAPEKGSIVQLLHRSKSAVHTHLSVITSTSSVPTIRFITTSLDSLPDTPTSAVQSGDDFTVLEDTFLSSSENGFLLSRGLEEAWTCKVAGAEASIGFPKGQ